MASTLTHERSVPLARGAPAQALLVAGLTVVLLIPFIGKAVHIDDPMFLWAAEHIRQEPLDFYGFSVNWYGFTEPMWSTMQNPPLTSCYMAAVINLLGSSETALHGAFLLWSVGLSVGTLLLARRWCDRPLTAAIALVCTPVFLVSSTTLMCDIMMTCLWVWAIFAWDMGLDRRGVPRAALLATSGALITAAAFTKYFGIALVPLLAVHTLLNGSRLRWSLVFLAAPVCGLIAYDLWTTHLYGTGLVRQALFYAADRQSFGRSDQWLTSFGVSLVFVGGCLAVVLFLSPRLWSWPFLIVGMVMAAIATAGFFFVAPWAFPIDPPSVSIGRSLAVQACLWGVVGISVLALGIVEVVCGKRDAAGITLVLWLFGSFVFAAMLNWSITARTILPMAPAVAVLAMRRISYRLLLCETRMSGFDWRDGVLLAPAAALAILVAWADYALAHTAREAATTLAPTISRARGQVWFLGHWGFQYYMQNLGTHALELDARGVSTGDMLIVPSNNCNVELPENMELAPQFSIPLTPSKWVTTLSGELGVGFYSSAVGPLPFAFAPVPEERYFLVGVKRAWPPGRDSE